EFFLRVDRGHSVVDSIVAADVRRLHLKNPKSTLGVTHPLGLAKAALKTPHSKRCARFVDNWQSRSVWSAVALAPLSPGARDTPHGVPQMRQLVLGSWSFSGAWMLEFGAFYLTPRT